MVTPRPACRLAGRRHDGRSGPRPSRIIPSQGPPRGAKARHLVHGLMTSARPTLPLPRRAPHATVDGGAGRFNAVLATAGEFLVARPVLGDLADTSHFGLPAWRGGSGWAHRMWRRLVKRAFLATCSGSSPALSAQHLTSDPGVRAQALLRDPARRGRLPAGWDRSGPASTTHLQRPHRAWPSGASWRARPSVLRPLSWQGDQPAVRPADRRPGVYQRRAFDASRL
jgi:hypothetical protein